MERWFKTGSIRPENRQPTTIAQSKKDNNSCSNNNSLELNSENVVHSSTLESTIPDVDIRKGSKKRKCLDMGFTEFADGLPQSVICNKVLPNSSIIPAKLKRHFETHSDFINKSADYFKRKCDELHATQNTFVSHVKTHSEKALKTSYLVSYELTLGGKLHTLAETLLKPQIVNVTKDMADEKTEEFDL